MQGFNMGRYVPPDLEGVTTGNKLHGKRPASTIRFEMPYGVWCETCSPAVLIGQGTRFNAQKKKVGMYHSTTVWSFTFRHSCGGTIEMRTDPKNTAYVVARGARAHMGQQKLLEARYGEGGVGGEGEGEGGDKARQDAFSNLEKTIGDRERAHRGERRIETLLRKGEAWRDPYARNQELRRTFRRGRKERARQAEEAERIRDRYGLAVDVLPEEEGDARAARGIEFGKSAGLRGQMAEGVRRARRERLDEGWQGRERVELGVRRKRGLVSYDSD